MVVLENEAATLDKPAALRYITKLLDQVTHASGINNSFFIDFLNPNTTPPTKEILHLVLQNWLEQKRILRRSLVQGLEATVVSEYWTGQMAYLDLLKDEINGCHVNLAWESLRQPALIAGFELPHSVDSQDAPEIVPEMRELRAWQAEALRDKFLILVAVAIFERQSQPVLRRTFQALNAWYGKQFTEEQRAKFELYFAIHTSISDITADSSFEDIMHNIPCNGGVEEKHAELTSTCFIEASKHLTVADLSSATEVFKTINAKQQSAWEAVHKKALGI